MGRIKRLEAFLNQGAQRTRSEEQSIVNGKQTWRLIVSGTMRNYTRAVGLWRACQKLNPGVRINNFETPKAFVLMLAKAIDGRYGDLSACVRTIHQYWKNTTAGLDREGEPVDPKIIESTTNFIHDDLRKQLNLPRYKHARKYAAMPHLVYLARLMWGHDWYCRLPVKEVVEAYAIRTYGSSSCATNQAAPSLRWSNGRILGLLVPPEEGIVRIHWRPDFLERPVYERGDGHIWSAHAYSARLHDAGVRARFPSLINHDFCAEGLSTIDKEYTSSQRRRHAGHESDSVYDQYYAPTNPRTDGQAVYAGNAPRTLPSRLLRLLKMDHNPESLPDSEDATIMKERAEILGRLRGLKLAALKQYREKQKNHPQQLAETAKGKDVGHRRILFSRISHLIRVRQRLSKSLFIVATIRGGAGRAVLKNLIELHRSEFEFEARPGLELENCDCAVAKMYASSLTSRSDVNPSVASQRAYNGSTSTAVTCRILHPRAHVVPPPLSLSSASCAPQAIGLRASTTGSATARAI
ncbi:hypothetical protein FRB96_007274 [Tulasnella sp. 330]|nr:hypothetical protein FRB96_007274 [Tulasnella sp. 330]